jgi:hypothetical protein
MNGYWVHSPLLFHTHHIVWSGYTQGYTVVA